MKKWSAKKSQVLYNIKDWGEGYFNINQQGNISVSPFQKGGTIDLYKLVLGLKKQGFSLPMLIRFPDILQHRVSHLCHSFELAMEMENYEARYTAVYPIKVNQQYDVVKAILNSEQVGLEAGSKAELIAILALSIKKGVVICNGYKDREYIRLALIGQKIGLRIYLVIEKLSEVKLILEEARNLNIIPRLGVRIKLASSAEGKWQDSGGDKSKFGLNATQVLDVIRLLDKADSLASLQLMHFHIGSQIPNIHDVQKGLCEAGRYYAELRTLGAPIEVIDVGGGLGVDYEGMRSRRPCSVNYSIQEYANNVVYEFNTVCNRLNLPKPHIITETGRAITAHHAVLITNIIDSESIPTPDTVTLQVVSQSDPTILQDLWHQLQTINQHSVLEVYHNASSWLIEVQSLFSHGVITLKQRAHAEQLYYAICHEIKILLQNKSHIRAYREVLDELNNKLINKYFMNFSLFRSAPDAWAIEQLFPIVPLHRLNQYPTQRAALQDLTCDSDGQFKHYVSSDSVDTSLPVHPIIPNKPYLLGIFLIGAYQEILGGGHNLFGNVDIVNIGCNETGNYVLMSALKGDTISKMLNDVNFDTDGLLESYRHSLQHTSLSEDQQKMYFQELKRGLNNYTYLRDNN
jgi:arginine decarboxylase